MDYRYSHISPHHITLIDGNPAFTSSDWFADLPVSGRARRSSANYARKKRLALRERSRKHNRENFAPAGASDNGFAWVLLDGLITALYLPVFQMGTVLGG